MSEKVCKGSPKLGNSCGKCKMANTTDIINIKNYNLNTNIKTTQKK